MLAGTIVIGLLILLVLVIIFAIDYNKKGKFDLGVIFGLILSILVSIEVVLLSSILEDIDSVVVFKDSIYEK